MNDTTISKRQRSYTLFLLVIVFTASHVDRQIVAILQEPIKQAFQISDTQLGLLTGFMFALFYATLGMPMAMWADRRNRRNLIAFSISLWSAMTVFCGMAVQFWQLLLARIGVGVGGRFNPPSIRLSPTCINPKNGPPPWPFLVSALISALCSVT